MQVIELKPCPFCGKMPHVSSYMSFGRYEHYVECCNRKCKVYIKTMPYNREKQAIAAWNMRAGEE